MPTRKKMNEKSGGGPRLGGVITGAQRRAGTWSQEEKAKGRGKSGRERNGNGGALRKVRTNLLSSYPFSLWLSEYFDVCYESKGDNLL